MPYEDFEDAVKKGAKSFAKGNKRKRKKVSLFACLFALFIGVVIGYLGGEYICQNDTFVLVGEKNCVVTLGAPDFVYEEEGVKIIEFGKDISGEACVETNMTSLGDGKYTVDTTVPGRYYIKYTVDSQRYKEICRIRAFSVGGDN